MLVGEDRGIVVVRFLNLDSLVLDTREFAAAIAHETTTITVGGDRRFTLRRMDVKDCRRTSGGG